MATKQTLLEHSRSKYMTSIPQDEALLAIKDLTPKAYQLLIYYYSKQSGWNFDEKEMAETVDIPNTRALKKYRKELIDKEYLFITGSNPTVYFIGRKAVWEFKYEPDEVDELMNAMMNNLNN